MTSDPESRSPAAAGTLVYLDANVLVAGIVRTLVLLCGAEANAAYRAVWSPYAETEAARHQPPQAKRISEVRKQYDLPIVPDGQAPVSLVDTDPKDMPILGAAAACNALFVVTENVQDFGERDLGNLAMSAVHPDLFLAVRVSHNAYGRVLRNIAAARQRFPLTAEDIHATEVAQRLPRVFAQHKDAFGVEPQVMVPGISKLSFRGTRCVRCSELMTDPVSLQSGIGPECRSE